MRKYTITLHGWLARGADPESSSCRQMTVEATSLHFEAGHLLFYEGKRLVRACAPGHWAFVVDEDSAAGAASYAVAT